MQAVSAARPQARQVADRFHLVLNLRGAVQQELSRVRRCLVVQNGPAVTTHPSRRHAIAYRRRRRSSVADRQRHMAEEQLQLELFQSVKRLQAAGRSAQAIMRQTGIGRSSVRKWMRLSELPTRNRMAPRPGMPDFYREYLQRRWAEGCQSARILMAEIQPLGYVGGYAGLAKLVAPWRQPAPADSDPPTNIDAPMENDEPISGVPVRHVSPQIATFEAARQRVVEHFAETDYPFNQIVNRSTADNVYRIFSFLDGWADLESIDRWREGLEGPLPEAMRDQGAAATMMNQKLWRLRRDVSYNSSEPRLQPGEARFVNEVRFTLRLGLRPAPPPP